MDFNYPSMQTGQQMLRLDSHNNDNDFSVEFGIDKMPFIDTNAERDALTSAQESVNGMITNNDSILVDLDRKIDDLTCTADVLDYAVAASCGILTGLIDAFFVGELGLSGAKGWSNAKINSMVIRVARKEGYKGDRLDGAIQKLEQKYKYAGDGIYQESVNAGLHISNRSHHLDDFRHHPTIVGLAFSLITQFSPDHNAYFSNRHGEFVSFSVSDDGELIGSSFSEKIYAGSVNWAKHLISDMSGSSKTSGIGMGLPGPILSTLKEISALPAIRATQLSEHINDLFTKQRFNLQSEMSLSLPVVLNEVLVRVFYFVRRFISEFRSAQSINKIDWQHVFPQTNHTLVRMMTVSTGAFMAVDLTDAAIRGAIKSGGNPAVGVAQFLLRINLVGIGRFAIAVGRDVKMVKKRNEYRNERDQIYLAQMHLIEAKMYYAKAGSWCSAIATDQAMISVYQLLRDNLSYFCTTLLETEKSLKNIERDIRAFNKYNPGLTEELLEDF